MSEPDPGIGAHMAEMAKWRRGDVPVCACVHWDADECARIRDGSHAKDDEHYYRRKCECICHYEQREDDEDETGSYEPKDR